MRDYLQRVRCVRGGWCRNDVTKGEARADAKRRAEREIAEAQAETEDLKKN